MEAAPTWMPWEFPSYVCELLFQLKERGIDLRDLVYRLQFAALMNDEGAPLYAVLGTPMRGIRGGDVKQHLSVWYIEPDQARNLSVSLLQDFTKNDLVKELAEEAYQRVIEWAKSAKVHWCHVLEARSEIATRRDHESSMAWFRGRQVLLLGCGALGSHVAVFLAQCGVKRLVLKDYGIVKPGLLVRQLYTDGDIGLPKVTALADRLKALRPDLDLFSKVENLVAMGGMNEEWTEGCEAIIDCTASVIVHARLEQLRSALQQTVPIMSMVISRTADHGIVTVAHPSHTGGPVDLYLRTKLEVCKRPWLESYAKEFYPIEDRNDHFQPEPGCSDPTFVGSGADAATMSGALLNLAAAELEHPTGGAASFLFTQPIGVKPSGSASANVSFAWSADTVCHDPHKGYEIRLSRGAWLDTQTEIGRSRRELGAEVETGGLLYGKRDDSLRLIWVTEATGPPPDSQHSADAFICGTQGAEDGYERRKERFRNAIQCLGTWHTHPMCRPLPSLRDLTGVAQILTESVVSPAKTLLLIAGLTEHATKLGAYVFARSDFMQIQYEATLVPEFAIVRAPALRRRCVGLALSGGGSRAIAFHLGCLRALNNRGVLDLLEVVSAVSGGSVIAALYMYFRDSFDRFESSVVDLLGKGLAGSATTSLLMSELATSSLFTSAVSGAAALGARAMGKQPPSEGGGAGRMLSKGHWTSGSGRFISQLRRAMACPSSSMRATFELVTHSGIRVGAWAALHWESPRMTPSSHTLLQRRRRTRCSCRHWMKRCRSTGRARRLIAAW